MLPGTTDDTTIGDQSNTEDMSSISLNFNLLRTSHGGVYVCEATVSISGITPRSQSANETVRVQSKFVLKCCGSAIIFYSTVPAPTISIRDHPTPYNGTNFTLIGELELHPSVDTNVMVSEMWSGVDDASQETTSPPYLTNLTFQPLASNSSGEYTITVSVRPSDNSQFIVENSNSASYTLTVRRE